MIDFQLIRDNPEKVAEAAKNKGYNVDIKKLLELDVRRRNKLAELEKLRQERNQLSNSNTTQPTEEQIIKGRELKASITDLEKQLEPLEKEFIELYKAVPNIPADDVPIGTSEKENIVSKEWGEKPKFDFEPKNHWEIASQRGLIDKERAAKVSGSRFAYIKGDLVRLQFAIVQYVLDILTNEKTVAQIISDNGLKLQPKAFVPILPPVMIREDIYDQMDRLEPREERYQINSQDDDLWLIGSAEHTLGSMYADELIPVNELPLRFIGYSTCFRQEAGTYGKDMEGIIRVHQFDKLEMETLSTEETGMDEHLLLIAVQEYMMQQLGLPYHVLMKCTADIGKPNARGVDIEAWLPGQNAYRETHTADYMTDYQARRLQTRVRRDDKRKFIPAPEVDRGNLKQVDLTKYGSKVPSEPVHTNDATAFAMGRTMIAIIENYQLADGRIKVPEVLQKYMGGKDQI
jgi:seryl-tRNA synthetase